MDAVTLALMQYSASSGGGTTQETVTGNAPITLSDASAKPIVSLTQTGLCTQASTPTPSSPVDIKCNNGVIKYSPNLADASQANTTIGYYIEKSTGQVKQASGDSNFMFEAYMPVVGGESYVAYGRTKNGGVVSAYNRIAWYDSTQTWISGGDYTQNTVTVNTAPNNAAYARFSCNPSGTTTTPVTQELVDSYYWVFQKGTEEPSEVHPYHELYVDGTAEVLTVIDADTNPLTLDATRYYAYCAADLTHWVWSSDSYSIVIPVTVGEKYKLELSSTNQSLVGTIFRYCFVDTVYSDWQSTSTPSVSQADAYDMERSTPQDYTTTEVTATHPYLIIQMSASYAASVLSNGYLTVTEVATSTQTASVQDLLSADSYADTQDIIGGSVTRKCGVLVLDGTENWSSISGTRYQLKFNDGLAGATATLSTHFVYSNSTSGAGKIRIASNGYLQVVVEETTLTGFTTWLSNQYSAGTPVIVVYPLATETAEHTTAQQLSTASGTNTVIVTAEVSPIALEAVYKSGSGGGSSSTWLLQCLLRTSQRKGRP